MRRQKCDRQIPCSRCIKRGEADKCTREWPDGGYDPRIHRIYPSRDGKTSNEAGGISPTSASNGTTASPFHLTQHTPQSFSSDRSLRNSTPRRQSDGIVSDRGHSKGSKEAVSTLEFVSWGKSKLSDYDLKPIEIANDPVKDVPDLELSNGFGATSAAQASLLQLLLPSTRQVFQLVEYHIDSVLWYHCCFHGPTFYKELQAAAQRPGGLQIRELDYRWAALLFSIMAGSLVTAPVPTTLAWGFQREERAKLTRQWFKATMTCLNLSDYMWRHHIYSVESITILIMSAHILGYSTTMSTLLGTALKIAQGLGLHKLAAEDDELPKYTTGTGLAPMIHPAQKQRIVEREVGRRLWIQLCNQDWFAVGFSEMYSIQMQHFTTKKPLGVNDKTMELVPEDLPLGVRFTTSLNDLAVVCAQMYDAVTGASTLYTKYEQVIEYDAKMRAVASAGLPLWLDSREALEPHWPEWVPWARRSFNLCYYHKIIMTHRPFLGRSFREPAFDYSRRACLAASKSILKEAKQAYDEEGPSFWIDQAFMVAAGLVLTLDTFHRQETDPELEEHRKLAETTVNMLGKFENSAIGQRGAKMLSSLLTEQASKHASSTLDTYRKHNLENGTESDCPKRQKFDVPKFVEQFIGDNSFTNCLKTPARDPEPTSSMPDAGSFSNEYEDAQIATPGLEKFEQLFPPHVGMSNSFLFEDLLNFEFE